MRLVSFFALGEALPPPLRNPATGTRYWFHGTDREFYDEHGSFGEPHDPGGHHDLASPAISPPPDPGGRLLAPERQASVYGEHAEHHWNTDLGVHFTSEEETARKFAFNGHYPQSRVAHCSLHLANPKRYASEFDMSRHAVRWAQEHGHHYLATPQREDPDVEEHFERGGSYSEVPDHEYLGYVDEHIAGPAAAVNHDIDVHGPDNSTPGTHLDSYLRLHPDREEVTAGFKQHLQSQGHDGVTYGNEYEAPSGHTCAIAFDEDRIHQHHWEWTHADGHPEQPPRPPKATSADALVSPNWTPEHKHHWVDSEHQKIGRLTGHFASGTPLYRQPKPEFPIEEYHAQQAISDEHAASWAEERRHHTNRWRHEVRRALSRGDLEPQEAWNNGYKGSGHDDRDNGAHFHDTDRHNLTWEHLPQTLYHATTNKSGVLAAGTLKSRKELAMDHGGSGLGGGESDTISVTDDLDTARHIYRALHEYHAVVTGKKTVRHMVEEARQGGYLHHVVGGNYGGGRDWKDGDPLPERLTQGLSGRRVDDSGKMAMKTLEEARQVHPEAEPVEGMGHWDSPRGRMHARYSVPMDEDEKRHFASSHYTYHAAMRQHYGPGKVLDPGFIMNSAKAMSETHPSQFAIIRVHPKPGSKGYRVSALGEWRTADGSALHIGGTEDPHPDEHEGLDKQASQDDDPYSDVPHVTRATEPERGTMMPGSTHPFGEHNRLRDYLPYRGGEHRVIQPDHPLLATQDSLDPESVEAFADPEMRAFADQDEGRPPRISHYQGVDYIYDGHHRIVSDRKAGRPTHVIYYEQDEGLDKQAAYDSPVQDHGFLSVDENAPMIPDHVHLGRLPAVTVPLHEITVAGQPTVDPALVRQYADDPPKRKRVIVRPWGDTLAVVDGHHTIAAARARGDSTIRVRYMDADEGHYAVRHEGLDKQADYGGGYQIDHPDKPPHPSGDLPTLYHGTNADLSPGDHIEPGHPTNYPGAYEDEDYQHYVHATPGLHRAWQHADNAVHERGGEQHVYEVEPTGHVDWGDETFPEDYESDEEMFAHGDRLSESSLRVVRKVPYSGEPLPFTERARQKGDSPKEAALTMPAVPRPAGPCLAGPRPDQPGHTATLQAKGSGQYLQNPYSDHNEWFHGSIGGFDDLDPQAVHDGHRPPGNGAGGPQSNKLLGVHFSALHSVAHTFSGPNHSTAHGRVYHVKLRMTNARHFENEGALLRDLWSTTMRSDHFHDAAHDENHRWNYGEGATREGINRRLDRGTPKGRPGPESSMESFLQFHPAQKSIVQAYVQHLRYEGHDGITYGNDVEGPRRHHCAIAFDPKTIETVSVDRMHPHIREKDIPRTWPEESQRLARERRPGEVSHDHIASIHNEPQDLLDEVERYHNGGLLRHEPGHSYFGPNTGKGEWRYHQAAKQQTVPHPRLVPAIEKVVHQVREDEGAGGQCGWVAEILANRYGWEHHGGYYHHADGRVIGDHQWNVHGPSGTIIDATSDQHGEHGHTVRFVPPDHPDHHRYRYTESEEDDEARFTEAGDLRRRHGDYWWTGGPTEHSRAYDRKVRDLYEGHQGSLAALQPGYTHEHSWLPDHGIFSPSQATLDPVLWTRGQRLRPRVRETVLDRMDQAVSAEYPDWRRWTRTYLAGGSASYWWGNRDLDILVGVDYARFRKAHPDQAAWSDDQISAALTALFRQHYNSEEWRSPWDGEIWHVTCYSNPASWDIRKIKPYAAYRVDDDKWIVKPPKVPKDWGASHWDEAVWDEAEAYLAAVSAIERIQDPVDRAHRGAALYHSLHDDRRHAFSAAGKGWKDSSNAVWKYMEYCPSQPVERLVAWAHEDAAQSGGHPKVTASKPAKPSLAKPDPALPGRAQPCHNTAGSAYRGGA